MSRPGVDHIGLPSENLGAGWEIRRASPRTGVQGNILKGPQITLARVLLVAGAFN